MSESKRREIKAFRPVLSDLGWALHEHIRLQLREECVSFVGGFAVMSSVLSMAAPGLGT